MPFSPNDSVQILLQARTEGVESIKQMEAATRSAAGGVNLTTESLKGLQAALQANTASLLAHTTATNAGTSAFGGATAGARQYTMALREMEGAIPIRAAGQFLAQLGLFNSLMSVAFPIMGLVAVGEVAAKIVTHFMNMFEEAKKAQAAMNASYNDLLSSMSKTNTELELSNVKLENATAKLERRPQNLLREALLESKKAADDLAESLENDAEKQANLFEKYNHNWLSAINPFGGHERTAKYSEEATQYQQHIAELRSQFEGKDLEKELTRAAQERAKQIDAELRELDKKQHQSKPSINDLLFFFGDLGGGQYYDDSVARLKVNRSAIDLQETHILDSGIHAKDQAANDTAKVDNTAQKQADEEKRKLEALNNMILSATASANEHFLKESEKLEIERQTKMREMNQKLSEIPENTPQRSPAVTNIGNYSAAMVAKIEEAQDKEKIDLQRIWNEFDEWVEDEQTKRSMKFLKLMLPSKEQMEDWKKGFELDDKLKEMSVEHTSRMEGIESSGTARVMRAQAKPGDEANQELRIEQALFAIEKERLDKELQAAKARGDKDKEAEVQAKIQASDEEHIAKIRMDAEVHIAELRKKEMEEVREDAGKIFDALTAKNGGGLKDLFKTELKSVEREMFQNAAGMIFGDHNGMLGGLIPGQTRTNADGTKTLTTLGQLLNKTPFAAKDPTQDSIASYTQRTAVATESIANGVTVASGGAGGSGSSSFNMTDIMNLPVQSHDLSLLGLGTLAPLISLVNKGSSSSSGSTHPTTYGYSASNIVGYGPDGTPHDKWGNAIQPNYAGAAMSLAASGVGAYAGFKQGGVKGDLAGAGSIIGGAASIATDLIKNIGSTIPLVGSLVSLGASFVSMFMGNSIQQREDQIQNIIAGSYDRLPQQKQEQFDITGYSSYMSGPGKAGTVIINNTSNITAMDSKSIVDHWSDISAAVNVGINNGHPLVDSIQHATGVR
jgi:hypothetical protein